MGNKLFEEGIRTERERIVIKIREDLLNSGQHPCGFIDSSDNLCDRVPREQIEELVKELEKY